MKLNWVSPLPPIQVVGAEYTRHILPTLVRFAEVTIWTVQQEWDSQIEEHATVHRISGDCWQTFNQAEMSFYNVGNNAEAYGQIWSLSRQHPGVVILHDFVLQELFTKLFVHFQSDPDGYRRIMGRLHGEEGLAAAEKLIDGRLSLEELDDFPLWPLGIERALGVVLHSKHGVRTVRCDERSLRFSVPLPFSPRPRQRLTTRDGRVVRLIDVASIDANQKIEPVLEALAGMAEKDRFILDVFGRLPNIEALQRRTSSLGLESAVSFNGGFDENDLEYALERSDLAVHLLSPTRGEASMTQLRIWEHGLPSLVLRDGWFRELDDKAVWFIRPERVVEDIGEALSAFTDDPDSFIKMGERGRQILERDFEPTSYAQRLIEIASEAHDHIPSAMVSQTVDRATDDIGPLANSLLRSIAGWRFRDETPQPLSED